MEMNPIRLKLEAAAQGNVEAFGDIVMEFQESIRGFIAMLGVETSSVEDIAQETFVEAFKALGNYDLSRPFAPWLRGIARNCVRRWRAREPKDTQVAEEKTMDYLMNCEIGEDRYREEEDFQLERLKRCVHSLPARAAEIVRLKYQERRKSRDIGRLLGSQPSAIRVTLGRIRLTLRRCIQDLRAAEELR